MKQTVLFALMLVTLCFTAFAQSRVSCPEIIVLGPAKTVPAGESIEFYALVGNRLNSAFQYSWKIDAGIIVSGQGTPLISVSTEGLAGQNATASVKISGLAVGCKDEAAETGSVAAIVCGLPIDEFNTSEDTNRTRSRLDSFFIQIQNDRASEGLIVFHFSGDYSLQQRRRALLLLAKHLEFRKMNLSRFTIAHMLAAKITWRGSGWFRRAPVCHCMKLKGDTRSRLANI